MTKIKIFWIILCASLAIAPLSAYAFSLDAFDKNFFDNLGNIEEALPIGTNSGQTQVKNEIKVSANTGGNVAGSGEIKEGTEKAEIQINTIINGEEIDPVEIKSEASEVKVESKIEANGEKAQVQRETEIDSVKKTESYEVDLKNPEQNINNKEDDSDRSAEWQAINSDGADRDLADTSGSLNFLRNQWSEFLGNIKNFLLNLFNIF